MWPCCAEEPTDPVSYSIVSATQTAVPSDSRDSRVWLADWVWGLWAAAKPNTNIGCPADLQEMRGRRREVVVVSV